MKIDAYELNLVAITLLKEGGEGADDGEEHRAQTGEQEVKGTRRGTKGSGDLKKMGLVYLSSENEFKMATLPPKDKE